MVMGNYKNSCVFNFVILLKSRKSQKFDAHEIYVFYSSSDAYFIVLAHSKDMAPNICTSDVF